MRSKKTTEAAAREATSRVLEPNAKEFPDNRRRTLPARPLVLGGDDLTIILRADLALAFVEKFITAFEMQSEKELGIWKKSLQNLGLATDQLPSHLTACAGIVFVNASQPFSQAYDLAESLCQRAKKASDRVIGPLSMKPSSLAFARITTSSFEDAEDLYRQEIEVGDQRLRLTLGAYGVGRHAATLPALRDLESLQQILKEKEVSRGPARKLMTLLRQDVAESERLWARWLEVLRGRKAESPLLEALKRLGNYDCALKGLPFVETTTIGWATPMGDVHDLAAIGHRSLNDIENGDQA
jgi:hypothetical protein